MTWNDIYQKNKKLDLIFEEKFTGNLQDAVNDTTLDTKISRDIIGVSPYINVCLLKPVSIFEGSFENGSKVSRPANMAPPKYKLALRFLDEITLY